MTVIGVGPSSRGLTSIGETPVQGQHESGLFQTNDTTVDTATGSRIEQPAVISPGVKHSWLIVCVVIVAGLVGVQLLVTQPLGRQLHRVDQDLSRVERDVSELVGARDTAWESSDLLRGLQEQSRQLEGARNSLETIRNFHEQIAIESAGIEAAHASLTKLAALQNQLIESDTNAEQALSSLHRLVQLRQLTTSGADETDLAILELTRLQSLATDLVLSGKHLDQLVALRDAILGDGNEEIRTTVRSIRDRRDEQVRRGESENHRRARDRQPGSAADREIPTVKRTTPRTALFSGKHRLGLDRVVPPPAEPITP